MENEALAERIVILETEKKTSDREIKELKNRVEVLTTSFNGLALTNQSILSKVDNLTDKFSEKFGSIETYIEELKTQPKKEINKFVWMIINLVSNSIWGLIVLYLTLKK